MLPTKFHITWPSGFRGKAARNRPIRNKNCLWWPCLLTDQNGMSNSYEGLPQMLPTTFQSIWPSCFRVEDFQKSTNQKQELPVVAMFVNGSGQNEQSLERTCQGCFLPSFGSFGKAVSEEKLFQKSTNQKQELSVVAIFVNRSRRNEQSLQRTFHRCFLPSFGSFGKAVSEEKIFRNRPIRNKNCLWWSCLLMDRDKMSSLYRGPPIDASYQVSVHLTKRFQRKRILKISQSETRVVCGSHVC